MSHKKLRTDKQCLNCGNVVEERFCSHCGQENLELNDSVTHLIIHYIQDLFHYDGKLWHTLKNLVTRPGLVAAEYLKGKRQSYLEPIKFYVFASTVFFLVFFFFIGDQSNTTDVAPEANYPKRLYNLQQEKAFLAGTPDTMYVVPLIQSLRLKTGDTIPVIADTIDQVEETDLKDTVKTEQVGKNWLEKFIDEKGEAREKELQKEYEGDSDKANRALIDEVTHKLPQLFFLSLPFFAFFLKLLYWRSRRSSYVEHFVFSIYHYAYLFIIMLVYFLLALLADKVNVSTLDTFVEWLDIGLFLYPFVYLLLSMKRFYGDKWGKLVLRYSVLLFLLLFIMLLLFIFLAILAYLF